jgi:hypothetical protein
LIHSLRASTQRSTSVLFSFVLSLLMMAGSFAVRQSKTLSLSRCHVECKRARIAALKTAMPQFLIAVLIVCLASVQNAQPVSPPPDGGYPGGNTAEGQDALLHLTTGVQNTAVGFLSLKTNTTGSYNTAIGSGTLLANRADGIPPPAHSHC